MELDKETVFEIYDKLFDGGDDFIWKFAQAIYALGVADERGRCALMVDHICKEGGGTYGDAIRKGETK